MFGWDDRATKAEVKHLIGGDKPARVVTIGWGQYEVTIPDDPEADVTYQKPRHYYASDPRQTFPNMEVRDGEMRFPLDDLVSAVLARVKPVEIAPSLWSDDDVKELLMEALATRYSELGIGDGDRRKFLASVKEAVHSAALDNLANVMAAREYALAKSYYLYSEISRINDTLAHYDVTRPPRGDEEGPQPLRIKDEGSTTEFKISGTAWNESREFWRAEVLRQFPLAEPVTA